MKAVKALLKGHPNFSCLVAVLKFMRYFQWDLPAEWSNKTIPEQQFS
jgi:hypothetical protein